MGDTRGIFRRVGTTTDARWIHWGMPRSPLALARGRGHAAPRAEEPAHPRADRLRRAGADAARRAPRALPRPGGAGLGWLVRGGLPLRRRAPRPGDGKSWQTRFSGPPGAAATLSRVQQPTGHPLEDTVFGYFDLLEKGRFRWILAGSRGSLPWLCSVGRAAPVPIDCSHGPDGFSEVTSFLWSVADLLRGGARVSSF